VRRFRSRGTPSASELLRTGLTLGSVGTAATAGVLAGVLNASRRDGANVMMATFGELGTALAGIDLRVEGEEHLWSHRPAVFLFNHQSGIDLLLVCKLLRRDVVGVAKQELRANPIFGPALAAAGTIFLDRSDRERAIAALAPAVDALRRGLSIAIAPEGTRSPTPRLGPFKKGAFHIAMAARAPVVPIVLRNAHDALPRGAFVIRPATVEVVVHAPIPTDDWTRDTLDARIEEIRRLYEDTLEA
jgi:putative phosphoserine phosphatase/1-acylglycerol-3-phosphate O-acyltransferase